MSGDLPVSPTGRGLKRTTAVLRIWLRTKAINGEPRLAFARFRSRRDAIDLFVCSLSIHHH
ncbi:MAG: hypothetical protein ACR2P1_21090, partial [Pseudomonadales bacterium]